jgi:hypothetical protein
MRVQRHASGSVRYDKRRKTWNYLRYDGPTRRQSELEPNKNFQPRQPHGRKLKALKSINRNNRSGTRCGA